ncbi:MAG: M48 family metallopeptidase [Candidatus Zixiibacteriota bacterium]
MSTKTDQISISGINIDIVRKEIKNLHLAVYPPNGRVRISAPEHTSDETIRLAIINRISWIKKQQEAMAKQERQTKRDMVSGESHYFKGQRYLLEVVYKDEVPKVRIRNVKKLELQVRPNTDRDKRKTILDEWYREKLKKLIPEMVSKWEKIIGIKVSTCLVKKMKTKWGSCNIADRRIWLNLELMKKPYECIEYILVHEMVHFFERHHNDRFRELMDKFMPNWRHQKAELKRAPLAHEDWKY